MSFLPGRWPVLACLVFVAAAPPLAANCKVFRMTVPEPDELTLRDGDHLLASVATDHGRMEARVTVRNKAASAISYTLGGAPLRPVPQTQVPPNLLKCLQEAQQTRPGGADGRVGPSLFQPVRFESPTPHDDDGAPATALPGPRTSARYCQTTVACADGWCVAYSCCYYGLLQKACMFYMKAV